MSYTCQINVESSEGDPKQIELSQGQMLFVLGANGTGKSTLLHRVTAQLGARAKRLSAHRQVWFHSNSADLLASQRDQSLANLQSRENEDRSRYMDNNASERNQLLLFDFVRANEKINAEIAEAARARDAPKVEVLIQTESPLNKLNRIVSSSNLSFRIHLDDHGKFLATRNGSAPYSISELSDGERAALLMILHVLNLPIDSVAILDEPERHLHRSIVSPMLTSLLQERADAIFIVSTHDVSFAVDQPSSKCLLLRDYDKSTRQWTFDLVDSVDSITEDVAYAILGARRNILFVEGDRSSLDLSLYRAIFPGCSVLPAGSSKNVVHMVRSIGASASLHRIRAIGIIDGDYLTEERKSTLRSENVFACGLNSIESVYYSLPAVEYAAGKMAKITQRTQDELVTDAISSAFPPFENSKRRLAALAAEARVRELLAETAPSSAEIENGEFQETVPVSVRAVFERELEKISDLLSASNYGDLVNRYSVKRSGIRTVIARSLGFSDPSRYEEVVRSGATSDQEFALQLTLMLEGVGEALSA